MFGRRRPIFVAFDVLLARGEDVRVAARAPQGRSEAPAVAIGARRWIALTDGVSGQDRRLFKRVAEQRQPDPVSGPNPLPLS